MFNFRFRDRTNTWPAFVDLFSNLVIILIFLLIVFVFLWTTTSVFNKRTGMKTIAELQQTNAEQSEKIRQMTADEQEAMRLLIQARARLESAQTDLESKDLSIIDLITAYENKVNDLQAQDEATKQQMLNLVAQLNASQNAQRELADGLAKKQAELQETMRLQAQKLEEYDAEYQEELDKLTYALSIAEKSAKEQEVRYIEMSTRLNKALADKVAELKAMEEYQSEFYRAIKIALGNTSSVQADGDRFIVPSDILFQTGSYKLSTEGKNQVRLISNVIKGLEEKIPTDINWIIRIDGHTDKKPVVPGNRAYADNMQLSILRARAVMNELIRDGVSARRLVPSGFGDLHPIELGTDAVSLQKNRRIELQLTNK
ncbi:MAG: OmpA family protein [Alphaproteobacteria bacterium]|nr:OmpA family protein [Alphaproteobacteria bacterium]